MFLIAPIHPNSSGQNQVACRDVSCVIDFIVSSHKHTHTHTHIYIYIYGPGSSVGIATDNGLDGPGSNPGGDDIFRPS